MNNSHSPSASRRDFLRAGVLGGGVAAAAALGCRVDADTPPPAPAPAPMPEPPSPATAPFRLPDDLDPRNFILHGIEPLALETRRDKAGASVVTPASLLFVRNNLPLPDASIVEDRDAWTLRVEGVAAPREVALRELRTWGLETVATVLQCSGNGRQFFAHQVAGSPWAVGAAGCVLWTGVPLRAVAERLGGATADLPFLTATGGEELPEGVERDAVVVERSIPRDKALDDCLLAWEMNGEPIPLTHGGPLRLIVPGYYGCNQIKYVKQVAFAASETTANIMSHSYRFRPIGEAGSASQRSMWEMDVKSWINSPSGRHPVARGPVQVHGVAFSGGGGVGRVEVSSDGGATWTEARLTGPDLGRYAWRQFHLALELDNGTHSLLSRAWDLDGNEQPELRTENHRGYGHNGWRDAAVTFEVVDGPVIIAPEDPADSLLAFGPEPGSVELDADQTAGRALFTQDASPPCGTCHTLSEADTKGTVGPNLNLFAPSEERVATAVTNGVGAMPPYGGSLSADQIRQVASYVRRIVGGGH
ncbi:MAG: molybdopterin-dependent oxidoreductase [Myxococcales bacterium]|nr:molybdopterin-dependent oxidoreductase [Myxococcales bacterium]MCB9531463.1 molybdopterin-dependent oxidoreductase [Myxococcales bacterium]